MSALPDDILKAAEDALDNALCHDVEAYGGSYEDSRLAAIKDIARAILAERQKWSAYLQSVVDPKWQPIETAPKDGTVIDLWGVNHLTWDKRGERVVNVKWGAVSDWIGRERDDWQHGRGEDFEPTHWQPLPSPPKP